MSRALLVLRNAARELHVYRTPDRTTVPPRGIPRITMWDHENSRGVVLSRESAVEIAQALLDGTEHQWGSTATEQKIALHHGALRIHPLSFPLTKESREAIATALFEMVMQP